ncbi:ELMO/CED-12 family protein [Magnaporthiopsis poae ATCC 64411]|uniref:ELMO/CED-12 family protein n=1 Tax=Magnaporthiopsis poae (strain ATCC 64411 / 73-15) TaxID=644358 RepID=A0A0C4EAI8_MAGP6|nr:ELMO/CED-12 family protein [Magnaporthiopsis poae ATCC 64411]
MQSSALQDLAHPLIEFQSLTKALLRRWKEVRVDLERPEHRRALKGLHLASAPDRGHLNGDSTATVTATVASDTAPTTTAALAKKASRRHNPEKWRRLGFETESPTADFDVPGFLGMMDLTDYVRKHEDGFQKLLLEQSSRPLAERCPVARASFAITMVLYEHFEVEKSDLEDPRTYQALEAASAKGGGGAAGSGYDKVFRPLLLQWSRLHTAGLHAFFRLWKVTRAERDDFDKVAELVRILIEQVVGQATRTKDVGEVEEELQEYDCTRLRELQMSLLELSFEDQWGQHISVVSNVSAPTGDDGSASSMSTLQNGTGGGGKTNGNGGSAPPPKSTTKITVYSYVDAEEAARGGEAREQAILTLYPLNHSLASEWLDGLLMLLNQQPITSDTNKLVALVSDYGLKIRLLNVRVEAVYQGPPPGAGVVPSREGLDDDYYYEL